MDAGIYKRMAEVEDAHWWFASRRAIIGHLLDRLDLPSNAMILEAGCGTGGNFQMLARRGKLYATELDDEARRFATSRQLAEVAEGRLPDQIPFKDLCFDLIVMTDVLEHLDDDVGSLKALHARLKPGGFLLLTVPAWPWLWSAHDESHHHRRRYVADQLRQAVSAGGYAIRYLSYYNFLLFPMIAVARLLQHLVGANREGHDLQMPSRLVNRTLAKVFSSERHVLGRVTVPFGVSLLMLARNQTPPA
jgi:SAM-dependent methyltransferase